MTAATLPSGGSTSDIAYWLTGTLGPFRCRIADSSADLLRARALRQRAFGLQKRDDDGHDARFEHLMVEDRESGALLGTCRIALRPAQEIGSGYAASFYDLHRLMAFARPTLEISRFVTAPDCRDPQLPRVIWAALTRLVEGQGVGLLFGCSSFAGLSTAPYSAALTYLARHHVAPAQWRPGRKAPETHPLPHAAAPQAEALRQMPPLLRSYLGMGGWVSDHAVIDRHMKTLHVFTAVEVAHIPAPRAAALRGLSAKFVLS